MNYGELISEAFRLTWRNRFLWVFGFLLGSGQILSLVQNANNLSRQGNIPFQEENTTLFISEARQLVLDNPGLFVGLAITLALVVIFLWLVSQGALIDGVAALHRGEERSFSSTFRVGLSNSWRLLGFALLFILIFGGLAVLIFFLVGLPVVGILAGAFARTDPSGARIAVLVLAILLYIGLLIVIFIPLSIMLQFGLQALVIDRAGVFGSIGNGYGLFRRHPGRSLLIWLIGFALSLGSTIALLILISILGLILAALFFIGLTTAAVVVGVVATVIFLVPYVVATGAVATFNQAYWTLAYLRLTAGGATPQPGQGT